MYVPDDKMKVNRFRQVAIPRPSEYLKRFGASVAPANAYTGDTPAPVSRNKVEVLADAEALNELQLRNEQNGNG